MFEDSLTDITSHFVVSIRKTCTVCQYVCECCTITCRHWLYRSWIHFFKYCGDVVSAIDFCFAL